MGKNFRVKSTDRGYKNFAARAAELRKSPGVTVGIHAQEGARIQVPSPRDKSGAEHPATVLEVAYWNEFGLGVPERSFIRAWFDAAKPENMRLAQRMLVRILKGEIDLETALEQMGALFAGRIQQKIAQGIPPPNAPATVAAKGSSTPLIASGQMRQSVTYAVKK